MKQSPNNTDKKSDYQIFSNDKYIYKISPTYSELYRYESDSSNKVIETVVFKRVASIKYSSESRLGRSEKIEGITYQVYKCLNGRSICGYRIERIEPLRLGFSSASDKRLIQTMYFKFKEYKKRKDNSESEWLNGKVVIHK